MLVTLLVVLISPFAYALACQQGWLRFSWSYRTTLPPRAAAERFDEAHNALISRAGIREEPSATDPETFQLSYADGRVIAETKHFETGVEFSTGQWERPVDRSGRRGAAYWVYWEFAPDTDGTRFRYVIGPNAELAIYLVALFFSLPRWWRAMRPRRLLVASKLNEDFHNDLITSLIAGASFLAMWGVHMGLILIPLVLIHEYGHVLGYRMTGKVGNRMMLVPFFGGIAIAGSDHRSETERAFCAIMGPAICVPVTIILAVIATYSESELGYWAYYAAWLCGFMNALNLLPALPLDGGHSLESILRSISPRQAGYAMMTITGTVALLLISRGYESFAFIIVLWGFPAILRSLTSPVQLSPMPLKSGLALAGFHLATAGLHLGTLVYLSPSSFM